VLRDALVHALQRHRGLGNDDPAAGIDLLDRVMRSIESTISPTIGMVAPTSPVIPPWVVTGTRVRWQIARNFETSSVVRGRITAGGGATGTPAISV